MLERSFVERVCGSVRWTVLRNDGSRHCLKKLVARILQSLVVACVLRCKELAHGRTRRLHTGRPTNGLYEFL